MSTQQLQLPVASSSSSPSSSIHSIPSFHNSHFRNNSSSISSLHFNCKTLKPIPSLSFNNTANHRRPIRLVRVAADDADAATATAFEEDEVEPTPDDLEYVGQIKRVLELLKKNRDMLFGEIDHANVIPFVPSFPLVKLTIMIEDPRDAERKRLLGIDDSDGPTREDLAAALEEVNNGKIPRDRLALRLLAEEMINWPNLEAEPSKKTTKTKSLYAKATDTGIDPKVAAKRLNVDWDSAAEIETSENDDENEVPSAVGYGALYLVTAFPVIIGISVVLILFYNSLQ